MHSTPAASDMVTVRWMWTGSPQPPPASSTTGILQTVRMSTTTWIISVSDSPASVTPLYQPSEPPLRYAALKPASAAICAMIGLSATGATMRSGPLMRSFSFSKSRSCVLYRGEYAGRRAGWPSSR